MTTDVLTSTPASDAAGSGTTLLASPVSPSPSVAPLPSSALLLRGTAIAQPSSESSASTAASSAASRLASAISESESQSLLNKELSVLLDSYQPRASHIIAVVLPKKIDKLTRLHNHYAALPLPPAPVFTAIGCQSQEVVLSLLSVLSIELTDLLSHLDPIKVWITLTIPRMQDQKGIVVTLKEDLVDILAAGRANACNGLEGINRYHSQRGKMVSKAMKFPLCVEWQECVRQLDLKEWRLAVTMLMDLRNNYAIIYDMISKNLHNLTREHINNFEHMY